jgi:4-hydroxythreonine-4-phosphate dehydrogenase
MKIGITLGDPAGIGPELILKGIPKFKNHKHLFIFGNQKILKRTAQELGILTGYNRIKNNIVDCVRDTGFCYGKPSVKTGRVAIQSIDRALEYGVDILITSPIVKEVIKNSIPDFTGHTEYFAKFFHIKNFAMVGLWRNKRIMLLTTHLPLRGVFKKITPKKVFQKIILLDQGLKKYFGIDKPLIGVSALNPHAFEFSRGEDEKIKQGINMARIKHINASGPYPADSLFKRPFNGFLAMYHDQAMIYLKSKNNGLNFTLGIPIIRLSPLYGAALDIAGKNKAQASGFIYAISQGIKLFRNVRRYEKKQV